MSEQKLERGMLLLDTTTYSWPVVWAVASVGKTTAKVVCNTGTLQQEATLRGNTLPADWRVISNRALAQHLADLPPEQWKVTVRP